MKKTVIILRVNPKGRRPIGDSSDEDASYRDDAPPSSDNAPRKRVRRNIIESDSDDDPSWRPELPYRGREQQGEPDSGGLGVGSGEDGDDGDGDGDMGDYEVQQQQDVEIPYRSRAEAVGAQEEEGTQSSFVGSPGYMPRYMSEQEDQEDHETSRYLSEQEDQDDLEDYQTFHGYNDDYSPRDNQQFDSSTEPEPEPEFKIDHNATPVPLDPTNCACIQMVVNGIVGHFVVSIPDLHEQSRRRAVLENPEREGLRRAVLDALRQSVGLVVGDDGGDEGWTDGGREGNDGWTDSGQENDEGQWDRAGGAGEDGDGEWDRVEQEWDNRTVAGDDWNAGPHDDFNQWDEPPSSPGQWDDHLTAPNALAGSAQVDNSALVERLRNEPVEAAYARYCAANRELAEKEDRVGGKGLEEGEIVDFVSRGASVCISLVQTAGQRSQGVGYAEEEEEL